MSWVLLGLVLSGHAQEPVAAGPRVRTETLPDGSVRVVPDRHLPAEANGAETVVLDFQGVSLYDLTLYFADILRKNLLLTDEAALRNKKVQLVGHEPMTIDQAWETFRSALHAHGFDTIDAGEVVTIVPTSSAPRGPLDVGTGAPAGPSDGFVTQLLPVKNAAVADLAPVVKPLLSPEAELVAYVPTNTLIVTDTASNVRKVAELVGLIDIAAPETTLELIRLQHAVAANIKATIEALYLTPAASTEERKPTPKGPRNKPTTPEPTSATGESARHVTRVLDDERTNTLVVLANPEGHAAVAALVAELDADVDSSERKRLHVLHMKYALAEEVAAVVTQLQSSSAKSRPDAVRPKTATEKTEPTPTFDGDARIAADPTTNSLAIVADPDEYEAIADLVAQLDIARRQVFVDAVFVELTSTGGQELGLGAHGPLMGDDASVGFLSAQLDPTQSVSSFSVTPDLLAGLAAGVFGPAIEVLAPDGSLMSVPTFGIALRALQVNSDMQVMGNPALLALDHQEAVLSVGRKIPFQTTTVTPLGVPIPTFDRLDVAMELRVTPHLNDDGKLVTLDIDLSVDEVESASAESLLQGGPVTDTKSVESRVMVDDGQTIVIATVAGTKIQVSESKVPILGDIPLLGLLFRGRHEEDRRTNLMVFLTPYVIDRPADLLKISMLKEAQRQEFVRRFQGKRGEEWLAELEDLFVTANRPD